ncbi:hypothetical protein [Kangiella sediminilitoris]|uniref:Uncharacterized protein n=1 Tax=Kangiella sediminilitoris TaxID=1144748 RepID=A0A1B3B7L9_9GAMM|nr:hypothetical protein [Kangiella sediminilitoris]AOE48784.1 hypothetical protein KS2013_52 [Kangiella sediminilitoris]
MNKDTVLTEYESDLNTVMTADLRSEEFRKSEANIIKILKDLRGNITDKDLERLTKVLDGYGGKEILVELAYTLGELGTEKSFDYLLLMFNRSFEDGCEEYDTAMACFEEMESMDRDRTKKEGVYESYTFERIMFG